MIKDGRESLRILIFGSCVSRDILNFSQKGFVGLVDYFARSSIASIASEPYHLGGKHCERIASDFQRRMVQRDMDKTFLDKLASMKDFDFILVDLIDERFDLYEISPGCVVTLSSEFLQTGLVKAEERSSERWIQSGSQRHRELWKSGIKRLFTVLAEHGIAERVLINKVFYADRTEDGTVLPAQYTKQTRAANELLAWMYEELQQYVPETRWMAFPEDLLRSNPKHRWGIAPFHYADAYYTNALTQLGKINSDTCRDGASLLRNGAILAWSGRRESSACHTCFLVFKNKTLVYGKPYSSAAEMKFNTGLVGGDYEVVIFTLSFDPVEQNEQPVRRKESKFFFRIA